MDYVQVTKMTWKQGSMEFIHRYMRPKNMNLNEWIKTEVPRRWKSNENEIPSQFIARIVMDIEEHVPDFSSFVIEEIEKRRNEKDTTMKMVIK